MTSDLAVQINGSSIVKESIYGKRVRTCLLYTSDAADEL